VKYLKARIGILGGKLVGADAFGFVVLDVIDAKWRIEFLSRRSGRKNGWLVLRL